MSWLYESYHINSKNSVAWLDFVKSQAGIGYEILGEDEEMVYFGKYKKERRFFDNKTLSLSIEEIAEQYTQTALPGVMVLKKDHQAGNDWVSKAVRRD